MADLDAAIEAAERHIVEGSSVRHDRAWWFAERAVTAAAPLIRAQAEARLADIDIEISMASPLHDVWCAALDTANSPDFRDPHTRCSVCNAADGRLDEALYLRRQRVHIARADAAIRADERAKVRAKLLAIADEEDGGGPLGRLEYQGPLGDVVRDLADRIAPEPSKEQR